jgi:hypothetical protein
MNTNHVFNMDGIQTMLNGFNIPTHKSRVKAHLGDQLGKFHDMYVKHTPTNVLHLILGFTCGVWV